MKILCTLMMASFLALMFAVYPDPPVVRHPVTSVAKPVILYRDKPPAKPNMYDVFYASEIPPEIPKGNRKVFARMDKIMNKVTIATNPSRQQLAALSGK